MSDPFKAAHIAADPVMLDLLAERVARRVAALLPDPAPEVSRSPWMTTDEAADYLRCKPARLKVLASQGRIPVSKEGGRNLYHRPTLDHWLAESAITGRR